MAKKKKAKKRTKKEVSSEKPLNKKEQVKSENKILRNLLIIIGCFIVGIIIFVIFVNSLNNFTYDNIKFETIKEGQLIFYKTTIPLKIDGKNIDYNFYLRNNPKDLAEKVDFDGTLIITKNMVINATGNFDCGGYGVLGIANLVQLYQALGTKVIKDLNASCDSQGRYNYINLKEGDKTEIKELSQACYEITIHDCEVLEGTERFMLETFDLLN